MNRAAYKQHCWGLAIVAPPFIRFCIFIAYPIVFALIASMTKWNGMNSMLDNFVGFTIGFNIPGGICISGYDFSGTAYTFTN